MNQLSCQYAGQQQEGQWQYKVQTSVWWLTVK